MGITTGILLFDDFEELDAIGPWEVFSVAKTLSPEDRVVMIAATREPVRAAKGLRVLPDHSFADAPPLDVVLVPGGQGTRREVSNGLLIEWLRKAGAQCKWVTSVCTGAHVLWAAGLAPRKRATTHWTFIETLRSCTDMTVLEAVIRSNPGLWLLKDGVVKGKWPYTNIPDATEVTDLLQ